jgi:hypothetical protein
VNKGDPATGGSEPRYLVHQAISGGSTCIQRRVEIRHSIADVVDAWPPLGKEFSNRAVRREWGQQLHFGFAEGQRNDGGTIGRLGWVWLDPENIAIKGQCRLQIGYGNAHMGNARSVGQTGLHGS